MGRRRPGAQKSGGAIRQREQKLPFRPAALVLAELALPRVRESQSGGLLVRRDPRLDGITDQGAPGQSGLIRRL